MRLNPHAWLIQSARAIGRWIASKVLQAVCRHPAALVDSKLAVIGPPAYVRCCLKCKATWLVGECCR